MKSIKAIELMREKGLRASHQRIVVLEYLLEDHNHPTVDQVYLELKDKIPSLSRTTIYNTLTAFVEAGLAQAVRIESGDIRFDINLGRHGHFHCKGCGKIFDVPGSFFLDDESQKYLEKFTILDKSFNLIGFCGNCNQKR